MTTPEDSDAQHTLPNSFKEELNDLQGIDYEMPATLDAFYRM